MRHKVWKISIKFLLICIIGIGVIFVKPTVTANTLKLTENSKSAILIETETAKVLYEKDQTKRLAPASMTKIMTLKLIFDALATGKITNDQLITTSQHAASMGGSQIFLSVGEQMSVADLVKSVAIASANDAAVALAETISGSEEAFVQLMNKECQQMGLLDTNFVNVTGLTAANHYTTAYDMAMIARSLISVHGQDVLDLTKKYEDYVREDTINRFWLVNTNRLVKHHEGIDGLKTGWTNEAGYCVTTTKQVGNMRLISVVMGCVSPTVRTIDTIALLNYGFANFQKVDIRQKGEVVDTFENINLAPNKSNIVLKENFSLVMTKNEEAPHLRYETHIDEEKIKQLQTANVGFVKVYHGETLLKEIPLEIEKALTKSNWFEVLLRTIKMMLG